MKKLLILSACLWALTSLSARAQAVSPPAVVVQIYFSGFSTQHLAITRGEGQTEDIVTPKATDNTDHKAAEAYQGVLAKLYQEGYSLKSTFEVHGTYTTTLVFEKRQ